jgi:hypothetical protein
VLEVVGLYVEIAVLEPPHDPGGIALHADDDSLVHRHGQRLRTTHAT